MIVNIGELCFVLFRCRSLSEWLDANRSGWFAIFSPTGCMMRDRWILFPRFADFFGSSSAHPLPHDVFHLFSIEGLVGEKIVHDRG